MALMDIVGWIPRDNPIRVGLGGVIESDFRFIKSGSESVVAQNGFSLGPVVWVEREFEASSWYRPIFAGGRFSAPLLGAALGGAFGASARGWGEWSFPRFPKWLFFRAETELFYYRWSVPTGTGFLGWSLWLGFSFHFSNEKR
jgi:hypothetical protein